MEKIPVFLTRPKGLGQGEIDEAIGSILEKALYESPFKKKVLIKPNLLKPREPLSVTSKEVILSVSKFLVDLGANVVVGDSPAFGTAKKVIRSLGIYETLGEMGVQVINLSNPQKMGLPCGITVGVSADALERDLIVNIPRLKVHCQMGITCAVKNFYGTIVGHRKALYHTLYGKERRLFSRMIIEISRLFPSQISLVDATVSMHIEGPTGGSPLETNFLASSSSAFALDTTCYEIIRIGKELVPIWKVASEMNIKGTRLKDITYPILSPRDIELKDDFLVPGGLEPITFNPIRLLRGRIKSLLKRIS